MQNSSGKAPTADRREDRRSAASSRMSRGLAAGRRALGAGVLGKAASAQAAAAHAKTATTHILAVTVDHALIGAGVAAAIGSASFAGMMVARDNSHPLFGGIEHLMIFAQPIGASDSQRHSPQQASARAADEDATGSILRGPSRLAPAPASGAAGGAAGEGAPQWVSAPGKGYVLRLSRKGAVMVEGPKGSYVAVPGVVLPDNGRILSIQNRNGRWVVLTENGVITEPAP